MIIIIIPAKGHSNRLPNKNMVQLNGRPMIDHSIDQSLASKRASAVYVTTDSDAIAMHAAARGIGVIRRPESLGGEVGLLDVYRHALAQINNPAITTIVGVQPDHPDRSVSVDDAIAAFEAAGCEMLVSDEPSGEHSGAHCIVTRTFLESGRDSTTDLVKKISIVDDCTNVHTPEDLERAAARIRERELASVRV